MERALFYSLSHTHTLSLSLSSSPSPTHSISSHLIPITVCNVISLSSSLSLSRSISLSSSLSLSLFSSYTYYSLSFLSFVIIKVAYQPDSKAQEMNTSFGHIQWTHVIDISLTLYLISGVSVTLLVVTTMKVVCHIERKGSEYMLLTYWLIISYHFVVLHWLITCFLSLVLSI